MPGLDGVFEMDTVTVGVGDVCAAARHSASAAMRPRVREGMSEWSVVVFNEWSRVVSERSRNAGDESLPLST